MSMSTRLHSRANNFIKSGNMPDARRILMKLLILEPDNAAVWQSYQETRPTVGEYQVVLRSLARRYPDNKQVANRIISLQNRAVTQPGPETAVSSRKTIWGLAFINLIVVLCALSAFFWFFLEPSRTNYEKLQFQYNTLLGEYNTLVTQYNNLTNEYGLLETSYQQLGEQHNQNQLDYNSLLGEHNQLRHDYAVLQQDLERTLADLNSLKTEYDDLQNRYNQLAASYGQLEADYFALKGNYDALVVEYNALAARAIEPPYIYIRGREVHIAFIRTNGALVRWQVSFDDLETSIRQGHNARANPLRFFTGSLTLENDAGERFSVTDYRAFVDANPFYTVVPDLYYSSPNGAAFIHEIWYIATQLTAYSQEIEDTPRYPLETLLAGGGDCEDTAILVASMLKAAPVDWDVDLVYMDLYNPGRRTTVNHLIVHVNTGTEDYFIETTNPWEMQPNRYVNGWYYTVGDNQGRFSLER